MWEFLLGWTSGWSLFADLTMVFKKYGWYMCQSEVAMVRFCLWSSEKKKGKQKASADCFYWAFFWDPQSQTYALWACLFSWPKHFSAIWPSRFLQIHILQSCLLRALADLLAPCTNTSSGSNSTSPWLAWCHCIVIKKPWWRSNALVKTQCVSNQGHSQ